MREAPRVCIMIPTYNQATYVAKAVESALAQDYPNIEIVISNDNSTDNTEEVLQPYLINPKIKYKRNSINLGRVGNYRICLFEYTNAHWVINLDGDDYYTNPRFISEAMKAIHASGIDNTLFYQGANIRKLGQAEKITGPGMEDMEKTITARDYFFTFFERNYFCHMATLYNRHLAIKDNFYGLDIISTDIFSFLHLCLEYSEKKVVVSKSIAGVWLQHDSNTSANLNMAKHWINFHLYIRLYQLAKSRGNPPRLIFKWIIKAGHIYIVGYVLKAIEMAGLKRPLSNKRTQ